MNKFRSVGVLILIALVIAAYSFWYLTNKNHSMQKMVENNNYWTCPMHPQVHADKPGKCPICGMDLVEVESQKPTTQQEKITSTKDDHVSHNMENKPYWTCPMHPEVHMDHAGECPICHMKLVLEKNPKPQKITDENRTEITLNDQQLSLANAQKYEVEKMTLRISIPVSGRFISSSRVAFQVYESDLRYVETGLSFSGESSFYPEKKLEGTISSIDSIIDPTSRTVRVVGSIKNAPTNIASETGFRGNINFNLDSRISIPESAVLHTGNGDLVYVFVDENKLTPIAVKLGLKSEGFYDVLEGLEIGQIINAGANFLIDSEAKIRGAGSQNTMPNMPNMK